MMRMTNDRMTNDESGSPLSKFGLRHSFVICHSPFVNPMALLFNSFQEKGRPDKRDQHSG